MMLGLAYVEWDMDFEVSHLVDKDLEELERKINNYCLMLPFVEGGKFSSEYSFVFIDWDVGDISFQ